MNFPTYYVVEHVFNGVREFRITSSLPPHTDEPVTILRYCKTPEQAHDYIRKTYPNAKPTPGFGEIYQERF